MKFIVLGGRMWSLQTPHLTLPSLWTSAQDGNKITALCSIFKALLPGAKDKIVK